MITAICATARGGTKAILISLVDAKMSMNVVTTTHVLREALATIPLEDTGVLVEQEENWKATHAALISA